MKKSGMWGLWAALLCLIALWTAGAEEAAAPASSPSLIITEACADNDFVWTLDFQDYLELYNAGEETVHLRDYRLQVKQKTAALPDRDVAPGEYCVVVCDGGEIPALSKSGCAVALLDAAGHAVDSVILPASKNQVWLREDGLSYVPSPGFENTREGAAAWHRSVTNGLIISEALPGNFKAVQTKERGVDVLEIFNGGKSNVKLSDYYLSDDRERLTLFRLPDTVLKPGQYYVLYCTENRSDSRHTGFKLSSDGEKVYLTKGKTQIVDALNIPPLTVDYSYGRKNGAAGYFSQPTLGGENATLYTRIAPQPVLSVASSGGHRAPFEVEVTGEGPFFYTTDGTAPTRNSAEYKKPIPIKDTTVLRVVAMPGGAARSVPVTAVYRFDTHKYTLPTVTVSLDWDYMVNAKYGLTHNVQDKDLEVPANITFLNPDGTLKFSQDCGLSIAGQTSRPKKNRGWKVTFRSKYGKDLLESKVFDDYDVDTFDSLVLRLGTTTIALHDILGTAVGKDVMDHVLYQRYRPVTLFIAGRYYGVYYLREHVNANFIVNHLGGDEKHVDMIYCVDTVKNGSNKDWLALMEYCKTHNLANQQYYDYVAARIDVQSFMDYFIWRPYTGDSDHPNIRYVRSRNAADKRWRIVIYDMDWAFQNPQKNIGMDKYTYKLYQEEKHNNIVIFSLLKNQGFRQEFLERLSYHMQYTFEPNRVKGLLNDLDQEVQHDLKASQKDWPETVTGWNKAVRNIRSFIGNKNNDRRTLLLKETKKFFKLSDAQMKELFGNIRYKK